MVLVPPQSKAGLMFAPITEEENSLMNLEIGWCAVRKVLIPPCGTTQVKWNLLQR